MSFTDPWLVSKARSVPGKGQRQVDMPGMAGTDDAEAGRSMVDAVGEDMSLGTKRPRSMGNAGGGPGNGAKGSGVARAQMLFASGSHSGTNSAGPEGKSAVDGTSAEIRSTKAAALHGLHGNKELPVDTSQLLGGGMVD